MHLESAYLLEKGVLNIRSFAGVEALVLSEQDMIDWGLLELTISIYKYS
jgi:hypothetical protein